ncbi:hypothetical protein ACH5RR_006447, partial [Cinchona calisaya]
MVVAVYNDGHIKLDSEIETKATSSGVLTRNSYLGQLLSPLDLLHYFRGLRFLGPAAEFDEARDIESADNALAQSRGVQFVEWGVIRDGSDDSGSYNKLSNGQLSLLHKLRISGVQSAMATL